MYEIIDMSTQESRSESNEVEDLQSTKSKPKPLLSELASQWKRWLLTLSEDLSKSRVLHIYVTEAFIFVIAILIDALIVWVIGIAAMDVIKTSAYMHEIYDWI